MATFMLSNAAFIVLEIAIALQKWMGDGATGALCQMHASCDASTNAFMAPGRGSDLASVRH